MHDLVVRGGRVALEDGWAECDIGITDGRIAELGAGIVTLLLGAGAFVAGASALSLLDPHRGDLPALLQHARA